VKLTNPATLAIGTQALGTRPLAAMNLAANEAEEGHAIHGILGYAFFANRIVTLDYPGRALLIDHAPRGGSTVPMTIESKAPVIQARLSIGTQTHEVRLLVDTGFDDTVILTRPFVERHALLQFAENAGTSGQSLGGTTKSRIAKAKRLTIGNVHFDDVRVRLSLDEEGAFASDTVDGYIGSGLLQDSVVTFNYSAGALTLRRR